MKKIKQVVLKKIQNGEVMMKPSWQFELIDKTQKGVWVMATVLFTMGLLMMKFFVKEYEVWNMGELGDIGRQLIMEDFPYGWLVGSVGMLWLSVKIMSNLGNNYKYSPTKIWLITIILALIITAVLDLAW